ncbi:MAG TPA: cohesin domain-containing protein [Candidatus Woesebacteria bacterium]|nr:cohesin domain-containing protein [Candidatus Woesebacteria bacterium]
MKQVLISFVIFFLGATHVYAMPASLSFNPTEIKAKQGQEIQLQINMFTGNEAVASTDVMINYDHTILEPVLTKTQNGTIFQSVDSKIVIPGKLYVYGVQENTTQFANAQGTVATITFKTLQNGTNRLSFDCNPQIKNTSQIIKGDTTFENIINCTATTAHTSDIYITDGNVLGAYTNTYGQLNAYTAIFGILVAVFSFFLFKRYLRLQKNM